MSYLTGFENPPPLGSSYTNVPPTPQQMAQYIAAAQSMGIIPAAGGSYTPYKPTYNLGGGVIPQSLMNQYGYGSAINVTPGSAYQTPQQLGALGDMMQSYAGMYGADAAANAQLGVAGIQAGSAGNVAGINADAQKYLANAQLQGNNYNADKNLLGIQSQTGAQKYGYDQNLAGIKDTNATNLGLGGLQLQGQLGTAYLQNVPKLDMLGQVLGGTGAGGTGGLGGGAGGAVDATGTPQTPVVPNFQNFNDVLLKQKQGQQAGAINKAYDTQANNLTNSLGQRGFSTKSPGFQGLLAQNNSNRIGDLMSSQRDLGMAAAQYNAQNALPYAQVGLNQYNAQADRNLRVQLANMANRNGLIQGLLV